MTTMRAIYARPAAILVVIAALDQWSKAWAMEALSRAEPWAGLGAERSLDGMFGLNW